MFSKKAEDLFRVMEQKNIQIYYLTLTDEHQSEYVSKAFMHLRYLSGFTGSNAELVAVCKDGVKEIRLWTDGRYFIHAEEELKDTGILLMRIGEKDVPSSFAFISNILNKNDTISTDFSLITTLEGRRLKSISQSKEAVFSHVRNSDMIPYNVSEMHNPVWTYDLRYAGESTKDKLERIRSLMRDKNTDCLPIADLCCVNWLFNVRGSDIACNPVALSFAIIKQKEAILYLDKAAIEEAVFKSAMENGFEIREYSKFYEDLSQIDEGVCIWFDENELNYRSYSLLSDRNSFVFDKNPIFLMKAAKNKTEQETIKRRYLQDSLILTKYLMELLEDKDIFKKTEYEIATALNQRRTGSDGCIGISFETIAATGANAAMMHYEPTKEKSDFIKNNTFLLIDSGGQYLGATTDVTRTIAFGDITEEMKTAYTDTVCSNLQLMNTVFMKGCSGLNLDILARERFWKKGQDYKCGTGHGIGNCLSVHETPPNISYQYRAGREIPFGPGMIVSDEPGVYRAGKFGVRIENILMVEEAFETEEGCFYRFRNLTMVPLQNSCMNKEEMSEEEIHLYNAYQKLCFDTLKPFLNETELNKVQKMTSPL